MREDIDVSNCKNPESKTHIVYVARYHNKVVYVGEGKPNRYYHLTSGTSHVYLANKHHFEGKGLNIEVVYEGLTKSEAKTKESELIVSLQPEWNRDLKNKDGDYIPRLSQMKVMQVLREELRKESKTCDYGIKLLKLLLSKVNKSGYVGLTHKQLEAFSQGAVKSNYVGTLLQNTNKRQAPYMDKYVIVTKVKNSRSTDYQLTDYVMGLVNNV